MTFRPGTNEAWIGMVGDSTWESVMRDVSPTSGITDFGWPCYEGPALGSFSSLNTNMCKTLYNNPSLVTKPYYAYNHSASVVTGDGCTTGSSSISGLAFGVPEQLPGPLQRRAVLRRLQPQLHLVHAGRIERAARPDQGRDVRDERDRPGPADHRPGQEPVLHRLRWVDPADHLLRGQPHPGRLVHGQQDLRPEPPGRDLRRLRVERCRPGRHPQLQLGPERRRHLRRRDRGDRLADVHDPRRGHGQGQGDRQPRRLGDLVDHDLPRRHARRS